MSNRIAMYSAALCIAGLAGCFTQRNYDGPTRDRSEIGVLQSRSGQSLVVDGEAVSVHSDAIELLPGEHELRARVTPSSFYSPGKDRDERVMKFEVKGGRSYFVKGTSTYSGCIWVVDAESGEVVSWDAKGCGRRDRSEQVGLGVTPEDAQPVLAE